MRSLVALAFLFACTASQATDVSIADRFKERCQTLPAMVGKVQADLQSRFPSAKPAFDVVVEETADDTGSHAYQEARKSYIFVSDKLCGNPRLETSLRHEMTHVLTFWEIGRARYLASPKWFREGLAVVLSGQWESEFTEAERIEARRNAGQPIPNGELSFEQYGMAAAKIEAMLAANGSIKDLRFD